MNDEGGKYDFDFEPRNAYGRAIGLLQPFARPADGERPVLLDLACGHGAIAEAVRDALGLEYVGVDLPSADLDHLASRGFEVRASDLDDSSSVIEERLRDILGDRRLGAITVLDGLEHLVRADEVIEAIARIAREHAAPVVLTVPNVAHRDVGFKLALGRWEYAETGLLDRTHVRFFTEWSLRQQLEASGLRIIQRDDLRLEQSDQWAGASLSPLGETTSLGSFLRSLRDGMDDTATVNQFVWLCLAGPEAARVTERSAETPSLSVILRTQGNRLVELRECLLSLSAQADTDFELIVVGHRVSASARQGLLDVLRDLPPALASRMRFEEVDSGHRSRPLNVGFAMARGDYCAVLDDDDIVLAHWTQVFRELATESPGRVLRARCAVQQMQRVSVRGEIGTTAGGRLDLPYDVEFSFAKHLVANQSPFMSLAFPRALFSEFGVTFDEQLTTTEDWDYLLRSVATVGVADSPCVTAVYRRWPTQSTSYTLHSRQEWLANRDAVDRKMDARAMLLPPGEAPRIRELVRAHLEQTAGRNRKREALQVEALTLLTSRTWRFTGFVRSVGRLLGRASSVDITQIPVADERQLQDIIRGVRTSRSWQLVRRIRP